MLYFAGLLFLVGTYFLFHAARLLAMNNPRVILPTLWGRAPLNSGKFIIFTTLGSMCLIGGAVYSGEVVKYWGALPIPFCYIPFWIVLAHHNHLVKRRTAAHH